MAFASLADELDLDGPGYDYDDEYEYDRGVGVSLADELLDGPDDLGRGECALHGSALHTECIVSPAVTVTWRRCL